MADNTENKPEATETKPAPIGKTTRRVFVYDAREFEEPDPNLSVDEVRQSLQEWFPELANADTISRGKRKNKQDPTIEEEVTEFKKRVGTKGADGELEDNGCWPGYCKKTGSVYAGEDDSVYEKINKGVCPKCGGKLELRGPAKPSSK